MNAIELLKKDHRTVESLFKSYEKAKEQDEETRKAELFASIKQELDAHARVEEEVFYPAFDRAAGEEDDKELVLEAGEEHKQVKTLLAELAEMSPDDRSFDAKMKVLKDNVEHHVEEEEKEMFPKAQEELGRETLDELGERMAALKERLQGETTAQPAAPRASPPSAGRSSSGRTRSRSSAASQGRSTGSRASSASRRSASSTRRGAARGGRSRSRS